VSSAARTARTSTASPATTTSFLPIDGAAEEGDAGVTLGGIDCGVSAGGISVSVGAAGGTAGLSGEAGGTGAGSVVVSGDGVGFGTPGVVVAGGVPATFGSLPFGVGFAASGFM
jgi:hypothetical protein